MARLGDLSIHIPEFMALALGAGVLYFIALYALEHTRDNRAVLWIVLLGALAFRLTLFPLPAVAFHRPAPLPLGRPRPERGLESLCRGADRPAPCAAARSGLVRDARAGNPHDVPAAL